jgi:hypothetical protein
MSCPDRTSCASESKRTSRASGSSPAGRADRSTDASQPMSDQARFPKVRPAKRHSNIRPPKRQCRRPALGGGRIGVTALHPSACRIKSEDRRSRRDRSSPRLGRSVLPAPVRICGYVAPDGDIRAVDRRHHFLSILSAVRIFGRAHIRPCAYSAPIREGAGESGGPTSAAYHAVALRSCCANGETDSPSRARLRPREGLHGNAQG